MRHVGERMARYLLLSGEVIPASEAARVGLINIELQPSEALMECALALAKACAEGGPKALAKTKEYLHQFSWQAIAIEDAAKASAAPRLTEECQEGLRAFFAKQSPPWLK
jgi:methylglutaconyl-CoA hydratase